MLAMICDLRVVAPEAYFQFPIAKYGLALDNWSIRRLSSLVGTAGPAACCSAPRGWTADVALQTGMANRIGDAGRRAGLGRRDRGLRAAVAAALQAGAQRRRRLRGPVARPQGAVRQGVGQPGRHRGPGGAHREARRRGSRGPDAPLGRALRLGCRDRIAGRRRLGAAGAATARPRRWAPAPVEIDRSPTARRTTATACSSTWSRRRRCAWTPRRSACSVRRCLGGSSASRPRNPSRWPSPPRAWPPSRLAVTWFGHSTALIEIDGYRVLTDPVLERALLAVAHGRSRSGCTRCPLPLEALPALDAVVISHDHYDHLDMDTVARSGPHPAGARSSCRSASARTCGPWRIPDEPDRRTGLEREHRIGELTLVCTPARHFSGRFLSRNMTLWSSWAIIGPRHRAFFGGDTGYTSSFAEIGADHGPFDLTLMPIGAYNTAWPDIHMNPEEAVRAHRDITDAGCWCPIHWARSGSPRTRGPSRSSGCVDRRRRRRGVAVADARRRRPAGAAPDDGGGDRPVVAAVNRADRATVSRRYGARHDRTGQRGRDRSRCRDVPTAQQPEPPPPSHAGAVGRCPRRWCPRWRCRTTPSTTRSPSSTASPRT